MLSERGEDVIILGIFSKIPEKIQDSYYVIDETLDYFSKTGLKKKSVIKTEKIAVIHGINVRKVLGALPDDIFNVVKTKLKKTLGLE